jgi:hypothetical protein
MGPKPINRIGQQFGRLTVLAYAGNKKRYCMVSPSQEKTLSAKAIQITMCEL